MFLRQRETMYIKRRFNNGTPTSSSFSKIYLQGTEHNKIINMLLNRGMLRYFRYVGDIVIVFHKLCTYIKEILSELYCVVA